MKKIFLLSITICLFLLNSLAFAQDLSLEAKNFILDYIKAANSYNPDIINFYSPNAKIIRVVEKKNGGTKAVVTNTDVYFKQLKRGAMGAKLTGYKNTYTNIRVQKVPKGYKVLAYRQPNSEPYKLPVYFIVDKNSNGKWKIIEESMNTKVQSFLKYAK